MPLTVLQTLPALEVGGVERGTVEVAGELVRQGHRALVISAGGALTADLLSAGARHYAWPVGKKSPLTLLLARKLRRFLMEQKVDILHARSRLPAWVAYLAWKNMPAETRPIFITTVHGPYSVNRYSGIMTRGQRVIAISEFIRDHILDNYPGVDPENISVIPRGVDPGYFPSGYVPDVLWLDQWRQTCPQAQGKALITLPGRITRWKGHADFIDIISALKQAGQNVHGLIAGGASPGRRRYQRELRRMVATRGLDNYITFLGHRDDMREVLAISNVVLSLAKTPRPSAGRRWKHCRWDVLLSLTDMAAPGRSWTNCNRMAWSRRAISRRQSKRFRCFSKPRQSSRPTGPIHWSKCLVKRWHYTNRHILRMNNPFNNFRERLYLRFVHKFYARDLLLDLRLQAKQETLEYINGNMRHPDKPPGGDA